jgi:uncharacterized membrane protein
MFKLQLSLLFKLQLSSSMLKGGNISWEYYRI